MKLTGALNETNYQSITSLDQSSEVCCYLTCIAYTCCCSEFEYQSIGLFLIAINYFTLKWRNKGFERDYWKVQTTDEQMGKTSWKSSWNIAYRTWSRRTKRTGGNALNGEYETKQTDRLKD